MKAGVPKVDFFLVTRFYAVELISLGDALKGEEKRKQQETREMTFH